MNNKFTLLFIIAFVALCAFTAGYWLGTEKTLTQLNSQKMKSSKNANFLKSQSELGPDNIKRKAKVDSSDVLLNNSDNDINETNDEQINRKEISEQSDSLVLAKDAGVIEMMEFLLLLGLNENADDIDQFGPTLDLLRKAVVENPDNMQILVDYFVDSDETSLAPYYITSVLQGSGIQDKNLIINNMVSRLAAQGTQNANKKLLHLVSSTGAHHDNEQIIDALKNIALYSQANDNNRTYALDLLMPYQLSKDEKSKVVNELSFALVQAPSEEISYMVENIIRFSEQENRTNLATNFLADTNDFSTRVAILSTMHNGSVKPNESLKAKLFEIAQNPNDPLSKHAKDTLMYVFELDNIEYKRLRNGG